MALYLFYVAQKSINFSSSLFFSAFFIFFRFSLYLEDMFRQLTQSLSLISDPWCELLGTERWSQTLLCVTIQGNIRFSTKRSALMLKPLLICACPWLMVKTKIITFQSDEYFSIRKNHCPKNLSKWSLTISYLENSSALFFALVSPNPRTDLLTDLPPQHLQVSTHTSLLPAFQTWKQICFYSG